jgi:hypothetical protein
MANDSNSGSGMRGNMPIFKMYIPGYNSDSDLTGLPAIPAFSIQVFVDGSSYSLSIYRTKIAMHWFSAHGSIVVVAFHCSVAIFNLHFLSLDREVV